MSKVRVVLNKKGVGALLKSEETQQMLKSVAGAHSGGWETDVVVLGTRAVSSIYSTNPDEIEEELQNHRIVGGL